MSISTYEELRVAVASRMKRVDSVADVPDYIVGAEDIFRRELRFREMEQRSTATLSGEYLALPTDFLEVRNVQLNSTPVRSLEFVSPEYLDTRWKGTSGLPVQYTIIGSEFQFGPIPSSNTSYTVEIAYYESLPALTVAANTNWLLTRHPLLYLYGALSVAGDDTQDPRASQWNALFAQHMESARKSDKRARWSGSTLSMKVA